MGRRRLAGLIAAVLLWTAPVAAVAQGGAPPVLFSADELTYDSENRRVRASGNVEVSREDHVLLADEIVYDETLDQVTALGDVSLLTPEGEVLFASRMTLAGDLRTGVIDDMRAVLSDGARIAAAGGRRTGDRRTEMYKAVYSPCALCPDEPEAAPLWQIKAVRVLHDQQAKRIEYTDAWLEVAGVPIAYTPFFSHPDPTVERKTGLLPPGFGSSSDLGFIVELPFFWAISPHYDTTLTPIYTSKEGPVLAAEYRHALVHGELETSGSITEDSENDLRGHLFGEFRYDLNDTWRTGVDVNATLDDTYLRRYGISSDQTLTSRAFVEGFRRRNYFVANAYGFQGLEANDDQETIPIALPMIDYRHVGEADRWGGRTELDVNALALTRAEGVDTRRFSVRGGWELPLRGRFGDIATVEASLRGDIYHVTAQPIPGQTNDFDGITGRVVPEARVDWRLPLVRGGTTVQQFLEPTVEFVVSPYGGNPNKIPNEDSLDIEFDENNLFGANRFTGLDRVEGGPRVNYGLEWGIFGSGLGTATVVVGQTYRPRTDDTFPVGSGLEDNFSDVVAAVEVSPSSIVDILYRARFDNEDFSPRRHELNSAVGVRAFRVATSYVFFDRQVGSEFGGREEVTLTATSQLSRHWRSRFSVVRDLGGDDSTRSLTLGLLYEDECLEFSADLRRTFFRDRDVEPTNSVFARITFKTLGAVGSSVGL